LYFLFIRDFTIKAVADYGFVSDFNSFFVDRLMVSGLFIVIGATSTLSIVAIFIHDKCFGILRDFCVTTLSKVNIIYSYIIAAIIISTFLTLLIYFGVEIFFNIYYDSFSIKGIISACFLIVVSNIVSSHLIFLIALFLPNITSFSTFETLYGVVIGFFTGVYIPIGYYPNLIRNVFFFFPLTQTTSMLRQVNTNGITPQILVNYPKEIHSILYETFGIHLNFEGHVMLFHQQLLGIFFMILLMQILTYFLIQYIEW